MNTQIEISLHCSRCNDTLPVTATYKGFDPQRHNLALPEGVELHFVQGQYICEKCYAEYIALCDYLTTERERRIASWVDGAPVFIPPTHTENHILSDNELDDVFGTRSTAKGD